MMARLDVEASVSLSAVAEVEAQMVEAVGAMHAQIQKVGDATDPFPLHLPSSLEDETSSHEAPLTAVDDAAHRRAHAENVALRQHVRTLTSQLIDARTAVTDARAAEQRSNTIAAAAAAEAPAMSSKMNHMQMSLEALSRKISLSEDKYAPARHASPCISMHLHVSPAIRWRSLTFTCGCCDPPHPQVRAPRRRGSRSPALAPRSCGELLTP